MIQKKFGSLFIFLLLFVSLGAIVGCGKKDTMQDVPVNVPGNFDDANEYATQFPNAEALNIDFDQSKIVWKGGMIVGGDHSGTVEIRKGVVFFENEKVLGGEFVIDMTTIKDEGGSEKLEEHLKGADFFNVEEFPETTFQITLVRETGVKNVYNISGDLTIKKIKKSIVFPATITQIESGKYDVKANFRINRTDWNINYNSNKFFKELGDRAIRDEIEFSLSLQTQ